MTKRSQDPIDAAIDDVESRPWLKKAIFVAALFCLASSLMGFFFLVSRLIVPGGFF